MKLFHCTKSYIQVRTHSSTSPLLPCLPSNCFTWYYCNILFFTIETKKSDLNFIWKILRSALGKTLGIKPKGRWARSLQCTHCDPRPQACPGPHSTRSLSHRATIWIPRKPWLAVPKSCPAYRGPSKLCLCPTHCLVWNGHRDHREAPTPLNTLQLEWKCSILDSSGMSACAFLEIKFQTCKDGFCNSPN